MRYFSPGVTQMKSSAIRSPSPSVLFPLKAKTAGMPVFSEMMVKPISQASSYTRSNLTAGPRSDSSEIKVFLLKVNCEEWIGVGFKII